MVTIGSEGDNSMHLACGNFEGLAGTRGPDNARAGDTLEALSPQLRKASTVFADNNRAKAVGLKLRGQYVFLRRMIPEVGAFDEMAQPILSRNYKRGRYSGLGYRLDRLHRKSYTELQRHHAKVFSSLMCW